MKARLKVGSLGISPALSQPGAGPERVEKRAGGGELTDVLGDEGVGQPDARSGRRTVAATIVTAGAAAQIGERENLAERLIQGGERPQFRGERGEKLALQVMEDRGERGDPIASRRFRSSKTQNAQPPAGFERGSLCRFQIGDLAASGNSSGVVPF